MLLLHPLQLEEGTQHRVRRSADTTPYAALSPAAALLASALRTRGVSNQWAHGGRARNCRASRHERRTAHPAAPSSHSTRMVSVVDVPDPQCCPNVGRCTGSGQLRCCICLSRCSFPWTPQLLRTVITNYGSVEPMRDGSTYRVTPIGTAHGGTPPRHEVDRDGDCISVWFDLPPNGEWSDLTATFDVVRRGSRLRLVLDDVHVM